LVPDNLNPAEPEGSGSWITPFTDINNCCSNFGKGTGADPPTCKANEVALPLKPLDISSMIL